MGGESGGGKNDRDGSRLDHSRQVASRPRERLKFRALLQPHAWQLRAVARCSRRRRQERKLAHPPRRHFLFLYIRQDNLSRNRCFGPFPAEALHRLTRERGHSERHINLPHRLSPDRTCSTDARWFAFSRRSRSTFRARLLVFTSYPCRSLLSLLPRTSKA